MQFIKSKFPNVDEVQFASEALEFVPKKKEMKEVPEHERCTATKKDGERCTKRCALLDKTNPELGQFCFCTIHKTFNPSVEKVEAPKKEQCSSMTQKGDQCKKKAIDNGLCSIHCRSPVSLETVAPAIIC